MKSKLACGIFLLFVSLGCNNSGINKNVHVEPQVTDTIYEADIIGSWVEPNPINKKEVQGFELISGGKAKSINMATLVYKNWWLKNKQLYLVSESIGNHASSIDTIAYDIIKIDKDSLVIKKQNLISGFWRK